jgi:hypothetical protein
MHRMGRIKVLRDHEHPIGVPVRALEDSKGLYTESHISDTQLGNETLTLLRTACSTGCPSATSRCRRKWGSTRAKRFGS